MTYIQRNESTNSDSEHVCGAFIMSHKMGGCSSPAGEETKFVLCGQRNDGCYCYCNEIECDNTKFGGHGLTLGCSSGYILKVEIPGFTLYSDNAGPPLVITPGEVTGSLFTSHIAGGHGTYYCKWANCAPCSGNPGSAFHPPVSAGPCHNDVNNGFKGMGYLGSYNTYGTLLRLNNPPLDYPIHDRILKIGVFADLIVSGGNGGRATRIDLSLVPLVESYTQHSLPFGGIGAAGYEWAFRGWSSFEWGCGCAKVCEEIICEARTVNPSSGWFLSGQHHSVSNCVSNPDDIPDYIDTYITIDPNNSVGNAKVIILGTTMAQLCATMNDVPICSDPGNAYECCYYMESVEV